MRITRINRHLFRAIFKAVYCPLFGCFFYFLPPSSLPSFLLFINIFFLLNLRVILSTLHLLCASLSGGYERHTRTTAKNKQINKQYLFLRELDPNFHLVEFESLRIDLRGSEGTNLQQSLNLILEHFFFFFSLPLTILPLPFCLWGVPDARTLSKQNHCGMSRRQGQPPGVDWEDAFHSLDTRLRRLQQQYNEKEEEVKQLKVTIRKAGGQAGGAPLRTTDLNATRSANSKANPSVRSPRRTAAPPAAATPRGGPERGRGGFTAIRTAPANTSAGAGVGVGKGPGGHRPPGTPPPPHPSQFEDVAVDALSTSTSSTAAADVTAAGRGAEKSVRWSVWADSHDEAPGSGEAAGGSSTVHTSATRSSAVPGGAGRSLLPDPAMVWGAEEGVQQVLAARALYHANEELRRELNESSAKVQGLEQELSAARAAFISKEASVSELREQVYRLVRERDTAVQEMENTKVLMDTLQGTLADRTTELSSLRARLVAGADHNELLRQELRKMSDEAQAKSMEAATARSQLAVSQSSLSSQRHTNEQLLGALKNTQEELLSERKKVLQLAREVQLHTLDHQKTEDLKEQLRRVQEERAQVETEHLRLMREFVDVTDRAMADAREAVSAEVEEWKAAASYWEDASKRLYKDMTSRSEAHRQCREECDAAKAKRDQLAAEVRRLQEDVSLCLAKLEVAWPQHGRVTAHLPKAELETMLRATAAQEALKAEAGQRQQQRQKQQESRQEGDSGAGEFLPLAKEVEGGDTTDPVPVPTTTTDDKADQPSEGPSDALDTFLNGLPPDTVTHAERVFELAEANAGLTSELEQLRLTHDVLQERLQGVEAQTRAAALQAAAAARREEVGRDLLARELDRVAFLEKQVHSLRGFEVAPAEDGADALGPEENILELFLGQLVSYMPRPTSGATLAGALGDAPSSLRSATVFCTADFLLHETVMTQTIVGLNGFLDTTAAYCIRMDALLLYYLATRELVVQLHRVREEEEILRDQEQAATAAAASEGEEAIEHPGEGGPRRSVSTLTAMEQLYETVAEGRVRLLDLLEQDGGAALASGRPTLRGHIHLFRIPAPTTARGTEEGVQERRAEREDEEEHLASVEFAVTARLPFSSGFKALVREALTEAPTSDGDPSGDGGGPLDPSPAPTLAAASSALRLHDPIQSVREMDAVPTQKGVRDWMSRSSSTSVPNAGVKEGHVLSSPIPQKRSFTGSHLPVLACRAAQQQHCPPYGHGAAATSSSTSSLSRCCQPPHHLGCGGAERYYRLSVDRRASVERHRLGGGEPVHLQPAPASPPRVMRQPSPASYATPAGTPGGGDGFHFAAGVSGIGPGSGDVVFWPQISPTNGPPPLPGAAGEDSSAQGLTYRGPSPGPSAPLPFHSPMGRGIPPGFTLGPTPVLQYFSVDIFRVELPADLSPPIPRLSCFYELRALNREVRLPAPPTRRYTIEYQQTDGEAGTSFAIHYEGERLALRREPLTLFFIDEDGESTNNNRSTVNTASSAAATFDHASGSGGLVWGVAVCELQSALDQPGVPQSFEVPMLRDGAGIISGAVVRVRLQASAPLRGPTQSTCPTLTPATALSVGYRDQHAGLGVTGAGAGMEVGQRGWGMPAAYVPADVEREKEATAPVAPDPSLHPHPFVAEADMMRPATPTDPSRMAEQGLGYTTPPPPPLLTAAAAVDCTAAAGPAERHGNRMYDGTAAGASILQPRALYAAAPWNPQEQQALAAADGASAGLLSAQEVPFRFELETPEEQTHSSARMIESVSPGVITPRPPATAVTPPQPPAAVGTRQNMEEQMLLLELRRTGRRKREQGGNPLHEPTNITPKEFLSFSFELGVAVGGKAMTKKQEAVVQFLWIRHQNFLFCLLLFSVDCEKEKEKNREEKRGQLQTQVNGKLRGEKAQKNNNNKTNTRKVQEDRSDGSADISHTSSVGLTRSSLVLFILRCILEGNRRSQVAIQIRYCEKKVQELKKNTNKQKRRRSSPSPPLPLPLSLPLSLFLLSVESTSNWTTSASIIYKYPCVHTEMSGATSSSRGGGGISAEQAAARMDALDPNSPLIKASLAGMERGGRAGGAQYHRQHLSRGPHRGASSSSSASTSSSVACHRREQPPLRHSGVPPPAAFSMGGSSAVSSGGISNRNGSGMPTRTSQPSLQPALPPVGVHRDGDAGVLLQPDAGLASFAVTHPRPTSSSPRGDQQTFLMRASSQEMPGAGEGRATNGPEQSNTSASHSFRRSVMDPLPPAPYVDLTAAGTAVVGSSSSTLDRDTAPGGDGRGAGSSPPPPGEDKKAKETTDMSPVMNMKMNAAITRLRLPTESKHTTTNTKTNTITAAAGGEVLRTRKLKDNHHQLRRQDDEGRLSEGDAALDALETQSSVTTVATAKSYTGATGSSAILMLLQQEEIESDMQRLDEELATTEANEKGGTRLTRGALDRLLREQADREKKASAARPMRTSGDAEGRGGKAGSAAPELGQSKFTTSYSATGGAKPPVLPAAATVSSRSGSTPATMDLEVRFGSLLGDGAEKNVFECLEYLTRPHTSWRSAVRLQEQRQAEVYFHERAVLARMWEQKRARRRSLNDLSSVASSATTRSGAGKSVASAPNGFPSRMSNGQQRSGQLARQGHMARPGSNSSAAIDQASLVTEGRRLQSALDGGGAAGSSGRAGVDGAGVRSSTGSSMARPPRSRAPPSGIPPPLPPPPAVHRRQPHQDEEGTAEDVEGLVVRPRDPGLATAHASRSPPPSTPASAGGSMLGAAGADSGGAPVGGVDIGFSSPIQRRTPSQGLPEPDIHQDLEDGTFGAPQPSSGTVQPPADTEVSNNEGGAERSTPPYRKGAYAEPDAGTWLDPAELPLSPPRRESGPPTTPGSSASSPAQEKQFNGAPPGPGRARVGKQDGGVVPGAVRGAKGGAGRRAPLGQLGNKAELAEDRSRVKLEVGTAAFERGRATGQTVASGPPQPLGRQNRGAGGGLRALRERDPRALHQRHRSRQRNFPCSLAGLDCEPLDKELSLLRLGLHVPPPTTTSAPTQQSSAFLGHLTRVLEVGTTPPFLTPVPTIRQLCEVNSTIRHTTAYHGPSASVSLLCIIIQRENHLTHRSLLHLESLQPMKRALGRLAQKCTKAFKSSSIIPKIAKEVEPESGSAAVLQPSLNYDGYAVRVLLLVILGFGMLLIGHACRHVFLSSGASVSLPVPVTVGAVAHLVSRLSLPQPRLLGVLLVTSFILGVVYTAVLKVQFRETVTSQVLTLLLSSMAVGASLAIPTSPSTRQECCLFMVPLMLLSVVGPSLSTSLFWDAWGVYGMLACSLVCLWSEMQEIAQDARNGTRQLPRRATTILVCLVVLLLYTDRLVVLSSVYKRLWVPNDIFEEQIDNELERRAFAPRCHQRGGLHLLLIFVLKRRGIFIIKNPESIIKYI
eukprot:gene9799-6876_t